MGAQRSLVEVTHAEWIGAPVDTVRAQFADLDHHIERNVHPKLTFGVLERGPRSARYTQEVKLLGMRQRDVFERELRDDGSMVDRSVEGFNQGGSLEFRFVPEPRDGHEGTRVHIAIRLPAPPLASLLAPLLRWQVARELRAAALEDKRDIEQRGYPARAAPAATAGAHA